MKSEQHESLNELRKSLKGELFTDSSHKIMYSTDASAYKETPLAVALPKDDEDIKTLVNFAHRTKIPIIPRGGGTSLAGQVVGSGIVVDLSKHFRKIIEINSEEKWVIVQPGVILNELNHDLKNHGLFFGPETSTATRCTLGGMLGNNACGLHSMIYGSTRDHILEANVILSDGSEVLFEPLDQHQIKQKCSNTSLEGRIYQKLNEILSNPDNQAEIQREYPEKNMPRRNTGYALDVLMDSEPYTVSNRPFNVCKLLAGSEGTLAFTTSMKLNLLPLPPKNKGVICVHFDSLEDALQANIIAIKHHPGTIELMDDQILKLTEGNIRQNKNRFFVQGKPAAILIIEFERESKEEILDTAEALENDMRAAGFGYHFPVIFGNEDISKVWDLRRSALGILSNLPGDSKPVSVIEDTAVHPSYLPEYIAEFKTILKGYGLSCVFHAHIGAGEIHFRPILNLKDKQDVEMFRSIARDTAKLVKKYKGSLSGEHGDGRLRGEFIPIILGEKNFQLIKQIKNTFDPDNIFNPGKIINTPKMNEHLRYIPGVETKEIETLFDFSDTQGIVRAIEKCNGSADCRNTILTGKVMCPSYQATTNEEMSTRARANLLREFVCYSDKTNAFDYQDVYDILAQCLSCKACKSECPSSVDMTKLKAEFMQHYYEANKISFRNRLIANFSLFTQIGSLAPRLYNLITQSKITGNLIKQISGFAVQRTLPRLNNSTLKIWSMDHLTLLNQQLTSPIKTVYFFNDEFSNYIDVETSIKAIKLLNRLNYSVVIPEHQDSGRALLSKGFVKKAQKLIIKNINLLKDKITSDSPLIGLDPSTILGFRDEYIDLTRGDLKKEAIKLSKSTFMIDEFLAAEIDRGNIKQENFTKDQCQIKLHGHCHQKALASTTDSLTILSFPENYSVEEMDTGCCGMAGSFGFEKEHYELSIQIAELKLLPEIRKTPDEVLISAPGTSCRQQIRENTGREVQHPVGILYDALKD